jgi:hypothetical protein
VFLRKTGFLPIHGQIANVFSARPRQDTAARLYSVRSHAFNAWAKIIGVAMVA